MTTQITDWSEFAEWLEARKWTIVRTVNPHAWLPSHDGILDCHHNKKPPVIVIEPWKIGDFPLSAPANVDVTIRGARKDDWYQVGAYSLRVDDLVRDGRLDEIISVVVTAWNAVAAAA